MSEREANQPMQSGPAAESRQPSIGWRRRREAAERAKQTLGPAPLIAGIDLGSRNHHAWARTLDDQCVAHFEVRHSRDGVATLHERLVAIAVERSTERIVAAMEPTGHWWKNVAAELGRRGVRTVLVNSLSVYHDRRIKHLRRAKGDRRDAELIAGIAARGDFLRAGLLSDETYIRLRTLAEEHEDLVDDAASTRQRVRALLELVLPEYLEEFADPFGETSRAVLRALGLPSHQAPCSDAQVLEKLEAAQPQSRQGKRVYPSKVRALIARLRCGPSFGVDAYRAPALARTAREVTRYEQAQAEREPLAEELIALYETLAFARVLDTIPSVAPLQHALLIAYLGDPRCYDRASCLISRAGTDPQENASGLSSGATTISRRGHGRLREVVHRIVMGLRLRDPHYRAVYDHLRKRSGNSLNDAQAMVALGNRYLRLVYRLCVDGKPFDRSRLEGGAGPRAARRDRRS